MVAACDMAGVSDRMLERRIASELADTHRPSLKRLAVKVAGKNITLQGRVGSFHEKQIAIQTCRVLAGRERLVDAAEVAVAN
jgi:osmotically-inducible protein OsmY